jgi:putative oxidoreductase
MKIAALIARILLGLVFVVFGSNAFLNFIPAMLPPGQAGQFLTLLMDSHYVLAISVIELVGGALLLIGWYVPLGLVLLGPVIMNILLFHLLLYHPGLGLACAVFVLWLLVFLRNRRHFAGIFVQRTS